MAQEQGGASAVAQSTEWKLDPVDFEILRHKLWSINDEAATVMNLVSASTVANAVKDMNSALMTPEGDPYVIGTYISIFGITLRNMVKWVLENCAENPGINDGDLWLCNDPYLGAPHQNDVAVFAPIFHEGELVAWSGLVIHQVDIGGPVEGSVQVGAESIYGEQPLWTPVKIGENGVLRTDLEQQYLRLSRLPRLTALDLRAKVAGNLRAVTRVKELIESYGLETYKETVNRLIDSSEAQFRARLRELPDGSWSHRCYLDTNDEIYTCLCTMTKRGDELEFDYRGSSPQAPAVINTTFPGLEARTLTAVLTYLCFDIGWCPTALLRAVSFKSTKGTILDAEWPGGCSKSTTAGNWAVDNLASLCIGRMLASSDSLQHATMAGWMGSQVTDDIFGMSQWGTFFGGAILDQMAGGTGARSFADGIDTGGFNCSISIAIANVEEYEFEFPMLYLYRRQLEDSGGAGKFRGGAAITNCWTVHNVPELPTKVLSSHGMTHPEGIGVFGGYPGSTSFYDIKRDSNIRAELASGSLPGDIDELNGRTEPQLNFGRTSMTENDVYRVIASGGGGYLDPLERDPDRVRDDVVGGLVSEGAARDVYGVVLDGREVDTTATRARRDDIRKERLADD
jgi:N-methylhydantoinase B